MSQLRIEAVGDATVEDWLRVHNAIIPTAPLTLDEVRERVTRNRLDVAYSGDVLVGNATVRPPTGAGAVATVIVRVLPEHRGRGHGTTLLAREMAEARAMGARGIETIVLECNGDGLRFAKSRGFVAEVDRYLPEGDVDAFVTLRLVP
jgi:GNAT superfamily N-acetyltransferase